MSFISMELLLLVLAAAIIYYSMPKRFQWILLLVVSYVFYASYSLKAMSFIVFTTISTYIGTRVIERIATRGKAELAARKKSMSAQEKKALKAQIKRNKRLVTTAILVANFGILAFLKYANFTIENLNSIAFGLGMTTRLSAMKLLLPLGISFYTFQSMGYVIDVYQGKYAAEKNLFRFALFVSFFPQILQGPIGRFDRLAVQFFNEHHFSLKNTEYAIQLMLWGYFKKLVLADRAAVVVNEVFNNYTQYQGMYVIVGVLMYSIQLYADFSGGMDVVMGIAQIFDIQLDQNFKRPYFSHSISDFWRRWHITLGTWMKDYIFYPFSLSKAMNHFGKFCRKTFGTHTGRVLPICLANILIFFIVGVWHGAAWKYIAYGLYNGFIIAFSSLLEPVFGWILGKLHINAQGRPWKVFQILRTFILVNIGWYFDMAVSFSAAIAMMRNTFVNMSFRIFTDGGLYSLGLEKKDYLILLFGCLIIFVVSLLQEKKIEIRQTLGQRALVVRWALYMALIFITPLLGYIGTSTGFIYAQF